MQCSVCISQIRLVTHVIQILVATLNKSKQLVLDLEQRTGSKWEKEYVKAVYCHPTYFTYMQSTS